MVELAIAFVAGFAVRVMIHLLVRGRKRYHCDSNGLLIPPPDVAAAINRRLDRDIAAELDRRRQQRKATTQPSRALDPLSSLVDEITEVE
jgi:hypothetical protein